ncbi:hypothetical protein H6CHR_01396 [Variovorax sp. PBL-H6]|uniref:hypothetical protein n=1 Tax=Variovorax sp. PBL-H6 TaxID=434009 RepID=UPI001315B093|nr:hypothetical protein [Variovorax sp. PBL-H6]VTU20484.1 hypothetical protein H6CHR_01396 [Variovorax sp. PBL-H6]
MKMIWNYGVVSLLTLAAAAVVALGEPASAELKVVEAATAAAFVGITALPGLALPASINSAPERKTTVP